MGRTWAGASGSAAAAAGSAAPTAMVSAVAVADKRTWMRGRGRGSGRGRCMKAPWLWVGRRVMRWVVARCCGRVAASVDGLDHQGFGLSRREGHGDGAEGGGVVLPDVVAGGLGGGDAELGEGEGAGDGGRCQVRQQDRGAAVGLLEHRLQVSAGGGDGGGGLRSALVD